MFDGCPANHFDIDFQDTFAIGDFPDAFNQRRFDGGESRDSVCVKIYQGVAVGDLDVIGQQLREFKHEARKTPVMRDPDRHGRRYFCNGGAGNSQRQQNSRHDWRCQKTYSAFYRRQGHPDTNSQRPEYIKNRYLSVTNGVFILFIKDYRPISASFFCVVICCGSIFNSISTVFFDWRAFLNAGRNSAVLATVTPSAP